MLCKRCKLTAIFFVFLLCPGELFAQAPVLELDILSARPHQRLIYTQGLFFNGPYLYESSGLYGRSFFVRHNFDQESVEFRLEPSFFAEGAALANGEIYLLTWREQTAFVLDPLSLKPKRRLQYKGQGWGLTWDGEFLWRSDGSAYLHRHLPGDMAPGGKSILVHDQGRQVPLLNELEWDPANKLILANVYNSDMVAAIEHSSGRLLFWLNGAPLRALAEKAGLDPNADAYDTVLNGLALSPDGKSLWLTGKFWPAIYEVAWPPKGMPER